MATADKVRTQVVEQTTAEFRKDWQRLSTPDRKQVRDSLNRTYELLHHDKRSFAARLQRPVVLRLTGGLGASLYSLRAGRDLRIILTIDDDPLFGRTLVTLFRAVRHDDLAGAYRSIAHALYAGELVQNGNK